METDAAHSTSSKGQGGFDNSSIAICGFSIKFPGDAVSTDSFWQMLVEKRCAMSPFPAERLSSGGFCQKSNLLNNIPVKGGHFIREDLSVFDADFFSISPAEASSIDPMQRWLLETTYRALENAGITMGSVAGSSTSVYTGSFGQDYSIQLNRDSENPPQYAGLGFGISMLANRLSWFFDLHGASVGLDSACSSSAMAIDIACQGLRDRTSDMSIVAGCNLTFSPETYTWLSNLHFLSPDGKCYPFDHRANGYARGEGLAVIILKRIDDAIRDGNTVRAVIRSTLSNEDGRTPGITQPSAIAQERLIRATYQKANLSMAPTRYFEAHGTGTQAGDPREARAISLAFEKVRSTSDPMMVGAVKGNIGHLEGASGLAGVIKTVLVLERGIIPPNTNFESPNPKIDAKNWALQFPVDCLSWPSNGLRRASVNSFGYGGANCHIIIDDAYHYMHLRGISGHHCTQVRPFAAAELPASLDKLLLRGAVKYAKPCKTPKLLVWSAADKNGLSRISKTYKDMVCSDSARKMLCTEWLESLAYTLGSRRTRLPWMSFAVLRTPEQLQDMDSQVSFPRRAQSDRAPRIGFVFSGQGAQWAGMGKELMHYSSFKSDLSEAETVLRSLGCRWSVLDELLKPAKYSTLDKAELSQTLCTVLQVALVNLLARFGITPKAVVGHSSGEIAAAYAGGYLSTESAYKLAYFRGLCAAELVKVSSFGTAGAMLSVGLSEQRANGLLEEFQRNESSFGVRVACINSPENVTLAGEEPIIDTIHALLVEQSIFSRKLRVPLAYHSRQMNIIADNHTDLIGHLGAREDHPMQVPMISSVSGERTTANQLLDPSYWTLNMISPVRFAHAVSEMCSQSDIALVKKLDGSHRHASVVDYLLEIGPHAALQAPIQSTLRQIPRGKSLDYGSVLRRPCPATETVLSAMGELYCRGAAVNLRAVNEPLCENMQQSPPALLVDLPEYPFDHSEGYWHESRLSSNYRFREHGPNELIGVRSRDWNTSHACWRQFVRTSEIPWLEQHIVNGVNLYPAAAMMAMAIEAASQLARSGRSLSGYTLRDVELEAPMDLAAGTLEVETSLNEHSTMGAEYETAYDFAIRSFTGGDIRLHCHGTISIQFSDTGDNWSSAKTQEHLQSVAKESCLKLEECKEQVTHQSMYAYLNERGLSYGPAFQVARGQRFNESGQATSEINLCPMNTYEEGETGPSYVVHPVSLDAFMHLCFTAFTAGGSRDMPTCVPSRIRHLWVSDKGLRSLKRAHILAHTTIRSVWARGFSVDGMGLDSQGSGAIQLWYEGLQLTHLSDVPTSAPLPNPRQFCMNVDCKVAIDKLEPPEISSILGRAHTAAEEDPVCLFEDLELLAMVSIMRLTTAFNPTGCGEAWKTHYLNWSRHHLDHTLIRRRSDLGSIVASESEFESLCNRLESCSDVSRLYVSVARNLLAIFREEISPIDLLIQTGLLKEYYEHIASYRCSAQVSAYMDLLEEEAGSGTRQLVRALCANPDRPGGLLRCRQYDFTDVSAAFLSSAKEEFKAFQSQMTFGTLDIEQDFPEQGYPENKYDAVLAVSVLHITGSLMETMSRVRKSLKPGGRLLLQESFKSDGWTLGFVFGIFPGWWLGSAEGRSLSPNFTVEGWDTLLKASGFSGAELVLRDFDHDVAHTYGWIVSTAVDNGMPMSLPLPQGRHITVVIDSAVAQQKLLAAELLPGLQDLPGMQARVLDLVDASSDGEVENNGFVLFLADYGPSLLKSETKATWNSRQFLVERCDHWLWVTAGGTVGVAPEHGMVDGLARTLRQEYPNMHLVTLALDLAYSSRHNQKLVMKIVQEMAGWARPQNYEQEYVQVSGLLCTRRLVEANYFKAVMESKLEAFAVSSRPIRDQVPFMLKTTSTGPESVPHFVASQPVLQAAPQKDIVHVTTRAASLHSGDHNHIRVRACAGIVECSGPAAPFDPGDHVFVAGGSDTLSSFVEAPSEALVKIPTNIPFADACREVPPRLAAYYALMEVAHLHAGESVLIHNAANAVGYAALQLARATGVTDLWATAGDQDQSLSILESVGIAPDRVLPKSWFHGNPLLMSPWKERFDLVLWVGAEPTKFSFLGLCVRSGRRLVIQHDDSTSSSIDTFGTQIPSNISLSLTPESVAVGMSRTPSRESLQYASEHLRSSTLQCSLEFPASNLDAAVGKLRAIPDGQSVVVRFDDTDVVEVGHVLNSPFVKVATKTDCVLDNNSTYLVCGGLGGLGKAIARWLVTRGARHLILMSRRGTKTPGAPDFIAELASNGVRVEAVACDAANGSSVRSVLSSCSDRGMPPIKGCIQAAMVMTETLFSQMDHEAWESARGPKVEASWNLHQELPEGLDFFIMLSSVMGNTYQDALAQYRVAHGQAAASLDIGGVVDGGYLTGLGNFISGMRRSKEFVPMLTKEVLSLLDIYCDPHNGFSRDSRGCQVIVGLAPPAHWKDVQAVPWVMQQPLWGHLHHVPLPLGYDREPRAVESEDEAGSGNKTQLVGGLLASGSLAEAAEVVSEALVTYVCSMLGTPAKRIDQKRPMHSCGLDSLSAITLRNWVGKMFDTDLPVFEILGGASFHAAASVMAGWFQKSCNPFTPASEPCELGDLASYSIDVRTVDHVVAGIKFCQDHNIRLTIKNSGHEAAGKSTGKGALSLWTHNLDQIDMIPQYTSDYYSGPAIRVGAGVMGLKAHEAASAAGYIVVGGNCPSVGIAGGYTQGGGHAAMTSLHGLSADNVLEWEVVTASGEHLLATPKQNADLYWALSGGGGGTFGVVISMTTRLHKDSPIGGGYITFNNVTAGSDAFWNAVGLFNERLPAMVDAGGNTIAYSLTASSFSIYNLVAPGKDSAQVQALLDPFLQDLERLGVPYNVSTHQSANYLAQLRRDYGPFPNGPFMTSGLLSSRLVPRDVVIEPKSNAALTEKLRDTASGSEYVILMQALNASGPPVADNAVLPAWRTAVVQAILSTSWDWTVPLEEMERRERVLADEITPAFMAVTPGSGSYLNEANFVQKEWQAQFYGANYETLLGIKLRHDPDGLFYATHAVGSESWSPDEKGRLCHI
ncbi:hypothetical protein PG991_007780 [Apiospora marii]|uniref:Carrier domain-containing protein n=1 Tax=Apiospora marii TaxID=335849 RepID=A0ABR1RVZ4_9PEZI